MVVALAVLMAWLLYTAWKSPRSTDLATYGAFALPVAVLVAGWVTWAWRRATAGPAAVMSDGEKLNRAADRLAVAVLTQWESAAAEQGLAGADSIQVTWGRPSQPMAGPLAAAVSTRQFNPLPGLCLVGEPQLMAGHISDLHAAYGGLGSGRLVIAGSPGAGKSGAAVLLTLAAVRYREQVPPTDKPKVPVPILVTAQDWDPRHQSVTDWLTRRLQETYPMFAGVAGAEIAEALISAGKLTLILDGLDELAATLRSVALQALSQQTSFRVVVLSRTKEMASAASAGGILRGGAAIELRAISPVEAARYLERIQLDPLPDGWRDLIEYIRCNPESALSKTLDNPLSLTLVRDTCQSGDNARELLEFASSAVQSLAADEVVDAIADHLLDRFLPAVYTRRPGQPQLRYDLQSAQATLVRIAAQMNSEGARDLHWWSIHTWITPLQRAVFWGLAFGVVFFLIDLNGTWLSLILSGPGVGVGVGVGTWFINPTGHTRKTINEFLTRRPKWQRVILWSAACLLLIASAMWVIVVVMWVMARLANKLSINSNMDKSLSPVTSWRNNRKRGRVFAFAFWLGSGIVIGLIVIVVTGPTVEKVVAGLFTALIFTIPIGIIAGFASSPAWRVPFAEVQLAIVWHTPIRLIKFLNDAHGRNVLRIIGPSYQFRHARLQDRLAAEAASTNNNFSSRTTILDKSLAVGRHARRIIARFAGNHKFRNIL